MRRIVLIALSIIALVTLSIFVVKIVKSELLKKDIANGIKDYLNEGKYCKYLPDDQMIWLDNAKSENTNNYDITEFVNYIIDTSKKCVATKLGEYNIDEHKEYIRIVPSYEGIKIVEMSDRYYANPKYMMGYTTDDDIKLYKNDKLEEKIQSELKSKLDYKDGRWYVGGNESKKIDLIYGLYVNYTPDNRIENIKPKKILNIKILNSFIDKIGYDDIRHIDLNIKYVSNNNDEVEIKKGMGIFVNDKLHFDLQGLASLYYSYPKERTWPKLQVCHYTQDAEDAEFRAWEKAKIKAEEERDPSTILVDTDFRRIEKFKKYNKYNNHSQYASIMLETYEDGNTKSYFRKFIVIDDENGKHIREEYMQRELPYKNKSIDEVMELYLNDKEQYSIDEELLKTGNALVKYERYTQP